MGGHRMKEKTDVTESKLQWHPAFYAEMQIEFEEESEELIFENEHQLGTKPREVDVIITKKNAAYQVKKNIGRFFRKYNLIEYKPPGSSMSIDDFYKVCGYACFYKADSAFVDAIRVEEITVTLVSFHKPREMLKSLNAEGRYRIKKIEGGIYYIEGGVFPIQLIITQLVSEEENFWLRNLTDKLKTTEKVQEQYQKNSENKLYKSVMDIIVKANKSLFNRREEEMCQALFDIYKEDLMKMAEAKVEEKVKAEIKAKVEEKVKAEIKTEVEEKVKAEIKTEVEEKVKAEIKTEVEAKMKAKEVETHKKFITNLIMNMNITAEKAMDILMIPEEERKLYKFG